jgi:hypothetical protein
MRVGVYVDGFNLYYGARGICGKGTAAWRWLDLRALASALVRAQATWPGATIERLTYCTARISKAENPSGYADQGTYIKALVATGSADLVEYGREPGMLPSIPPGALRVGFLCP